MAAISNSYNGSTAFGIDKVAQYNVTNTFGHGGIGGKPESDVVGYVKVPDGVSAPVGGGVFASVPWYPASAAAAKDQMRTLIGVDLMFTSSDATLAFEYQGVETLESTDARAYGSVFNVSPANGLKRGLSAISFMPENAPKRYLSFPGVFCCCKVL